MQTQLQQAVYLHQEAFLEDLKEIMQVASVKSEPAPNAPFGLKLKEALEVVKAMAIRLGFEFTVVNDAVGYIQLGTGDDYIGVISHLDVVPEGELDQWDYPPFDLTEKEGRLYGRGVLDNKGPLISCLYGLYLIKESGLPIQKPLRLMFGTDEESGSSDIPMYLAKEKPPVFAFTPDCKYPVVYGEMGYLNLSVTTEITDGSCEWVQDLKIDAHASKIPDKLTYRRKDEAEVTHIQGKSAPTNAPDMADNVILKLLKQVEDKGQGQLQTIFAKMASKLDPKGSGTAFGFQEPIQIVPYDLKIGAGKVTTALVIRYGIELTQEQVLAQLQTVDNHWGELTINRAMPSVVMDKTRDEIKIMSHIYETLTGLDGTPVTTTGATYARHMPNTVAFGPSMPGQRAIAHLPNEWMDVADLMKNFEIYTLTMYELVKWR